MPNYGAYAQRVPSTGGANLTDVDIYKLLMLCRLSAELWIVMDYR